MVDLRLRWLLYLFLILLRVVFAFGSGYIHPDEWFQYGEILAGDIYDIDVLRTWEFDPKYPCRSMASLRLFGLPFLLLGNAPSAWNFLLTSRLTFLLYTFILDWAAWQLLPLSARWKGLLIWAGSGAVFSFGVHSFSNNIEAAMLALCLVAMRKLSFTVQSQDLQSTNWRRWSISLGIFASLGLFCRFTFAIFALPFGLYYYRLAQERSKIHKSDWKGTVRYTSDAIFPALIVATLHVLYDTRYYCLQLGRSIWSWPVVVPINSAFYNLKIDNLALHGTHPRWLHFAINAPMIVGIGPWLYCLASFVNWKRTVKTTDPRQRTEQAMQRVLKTTIFLSLAILSIQPHQEPRFLLPLVLPCCLLFANSRSFVRFALLWTTIFQSFVMAIFFGILHQGGTIPSMIDIQTLLPSLASDQDTSSIQLLFWNSFMPPRHLILPINQGAKKVLVSDCQSIPISQLLDVITTSTESAAKIILFLPSWALNMDGNKEMLRNHNIVLTPLTRYYPHVDTDHLVESIAAIFHGHQIWESFSYAAYNVQQTIVGH